MENFSNENWASIINGRILNDLGETNPPVTFQEIDPPSVLRRGQGGGAIRMDRINPGMRVTISLNPGSPDSAYMQGLFNSKANISAGFSQIGTLEVYTGTEGVIVSRGGTGRGGTTITDDQYVIEFNGWTESRGGA